LSGQWERPEAFFSFSSYDTPSTIFRYDIPRNARTAWWRQSVPFDGAGFEVRQVWYTSRDGTRVPMFVAHRRGLALDGTNPVYLTAYGGFNLSQTPGFSATYALWMERGGVLATTAMETRTLTGSAGARLPTGLTVRGTYRDTEGTTWVLQRDGQAPLAQHTREWPSGSLTWLARPGGLLGRAVSSLSAQAQYRVSETTVRQGVGAAVAAPAPTAPPALTQSHVRLFTPSVTVTWTAGITTGAHYGESRTDLTAAGNTTRNDRVDWGGNLSFPFRAPRSLVRLPNPIRTVLSGSASDTRACLIRAGTSECAAVADSRRRQLDARMDTGMSSTVVGGLSFSYILTDQRHLSSRFSQYVFTVFAEINFVTGRAP